MKKIFLSLVAATALLASCNPVVDDKSLDETHYTADDLSNCINFKVYKDAECTQEAGPAEGNYVKYWTTPATTVTILQKTEDSEDQLTFGPSGVFKLAPRRGASSDQNVWVRTVNTDNSVVETMKTVSVWVKTDLDPELKLFLGEAGVKKWGWAEDGYEVWGNAGNSGNGAGYTAYNVDGKWWGVTESAELANSQMAHCAGDEANGAKYAATGSYMQVDEDNNITAYTADGDLISSSKYSIKDYDATRASGWSIGTLETQDACVLWPYSINENGAKVKKFDIMYLDKNHMTLAYTKGNGAGSWGEITYWRFKNLTPSTDALEGAEKWYWANDGYECWGNAGNSGNGAGYTWNNVDGKWWGVTTAADLTGQLQHAGGADYGDADPEAYMVFSNGTVKSCKADGTEIRSGKYALDVYDSRNSGWNIGLLKTTAPALLFPWSINEGGTSVTDFDIMHFDGGYMTLVYTKGNASGSWGEITYWRFSTKH